MLTGGRLRARRLYPDRPTQEHALSPTGHAVSTVRSGRRGDSLVVTARRGVGPTRTVARFRGGISGQAWLPDGRSVCVTAADRRSTTERVWLVGLDGRRTDVTPPGRPGSAVLIDRDQARRSGVPVRVAHPADGPDRLHLICPDGTAEPLGPPADLDRWLLDGGDRLRAGARWELDGTLVVLVPDGDSWTEVWRLAAPAALLTHPAELSGDGERLLLTGPFGGDEIAGAELDLHTGTVRVLLREPGRDVDAVLLRPADRRPRLVRLAGLRQRHQPVDPTADAGTAAELTRLTALHGGELRVVGSARDDSAWLVRATDDVAPERLLLWDRHARTSRQLGAPDRRRGRARTLTVRLTASDGLRLEGYLTLPDHDRPAPTVLLVHGGPWARDEWGFDPDVQWWAGLGYACLQVGFRGSEGRGAAFLGAADHDWGGRMQTDLVDAARWAVAEGYADPRRLAILGSSYGGYAALAAVTFGPPVFAAAVAVCAPSDLVAFTAPLPERRSYLHALFLHRLGHPERDREQLRERSPLTHAARCHTPVLLVHGALDPLMPLAQSERMAAALQEHDRPHRTLVFPDEAHGIHRPANRRRLACEAHRFLAAHTRPTPAPEVMP